MTTYLSTDTHDMTDRMSRQEQLFRHQYWYIIQDHINAIGEVIIDTNEHNRYVREILHKHLIPWGYCHISSIEDRKVIHHAYAMCSIARDAYNNLSTSIPLLKKNTGVEICSIIDAQRDMLQNALTLLEKDIQTALYHMK